MHICIPTTAADFSIGVWNSCRHSGSEARTYKKLTGNPTSPYSLLLPLLVLFLLQHPKTKAPFAGNAKGYLKAHGT